MQVYILDEQNSSDNSVVEPSSVTVCSDYSTVEDPFERGAEFLSKTFGDRGWEPEGAFRKPLAHFLAAKCNRMEKAREIWNLIDVGRKWSLCRLLVRLDLYYNLEQNFGQDKVQCRRL